MTRSSLFALIALALLALCASGSALGASAPASPVVAASSPQPADLGKPLAAAIFGQGAGSTWAVTADSGVCGLRSYFCRACPPSLTEEQLCYTQECSGTLVLYCDACAPKCVLPPG
jgi:hypothetical protein